MLITPRSLAQARTQQNVPSLDTTNLPIALNREDTHNTLAEADALEEPNGREDGNFNEQSCSPRVPSGPVLYNSSIADGQAHQTSSMQSDDSTVQDQPQNALKRSKKPLERENSLNRSQTPSERRHYSRSDIATECATRPDSRYAFFWPSKIYEQIFIEFRMLHTHKSKSE